MQFERLRKSHKKEIIIGALAVCVIGGILTFATSRAFYRVDDSIDLAKGTINYIIPDLRIVALKTSDDGINYIATENIPTNGYTINTEKSVCNVTTEESGIENAPKDNNITIEYINGKININGVTKKSTRCYIYFDKQLTSGDTLEKLNITNYKTTTPNFSQTATTDEGIYAESDGMYGGISYYWRGAATTNYLKFAGFCWRIIRVNGDGSIRLIYDGETCHTNGENTSNNTVEDTYYATINGLNNISSYVGWTYTIGQRPIENKTGTSSYIKSQIDEWFTTNITGINADKVAYGKFCNDRNIASGYNWSATGNSFVYDGSIRLKNKYTPTLKCEDIDIYILKAGAITADEVSYAGGVKNTGNQYYYLYNGSGYWTMSPDSWTGRYAYVFYVDTGGSLNNNNVGQKTPLRPVINLKSDITFSGGDGTLNNPYIVAD